MQLIVCEKPSVAEKLAKALSEGSFQRKKQGKVSYFEFERGGEKITVAPAVGHIYSLRQASKGAGYPVFDIEWAPSHEVSKGAAFTKAYLTLLKKLGKKADKFVIACDYDLEGSLIGFNVLRFACGVEEGLRMKFSALTEEDLLEAFETAEGLDYSNIWAGDTRHRLDWFYGINLSRALMNAVRAAGMFRVMSIGRVQGPALRILSARELEIRNFVPTPFWQLEAVVLDTKFLHEKNRFLKKEEAEAAKSNTSKEGKVDSVERKSFETPPNPPFDLTSLQLEAYKCFKFSPAQTLALAQTLYEASMISYPRTSSQQLPKKLNVKKILNDLSKQPAFKKLAGKLILEKRFKPREGKKTDPAHPAIYPTGVNIEVGERERKLYDLIVKRFLACFASNARRESMSVKLLLGSERYVTRGARTVEKNWIEVYAPYAKFEEVTLPDFREGEQVSVQELSMPKKETKPPARFTPASIIEVLESKSLGTKATRSSIIETLFKRGYVTGKKIEVTEFGLSVVEALGKHCSEILDPELTREFEEKVQEIQEGKAGEEEVLEEGKKFLSKVLEEFKEKEREIGLDLVVALKKSEEEASHLGKCPKCGGELRILRSRFGKNFVGCSGYPKCTNTYSLPQNALIRPAGKICGKCGTPVVRVIRKGRRPFEMCLDPECETKKDWGKKKEWKKKK